MPHSLIPYQPTSKFSGLPRARCGPERDLDVVPDVLDGSGLPWVWGLGFRVEG